MKTYDVFSIKKNRKYAWKYQFNFVPKISKFLKYKVCIVNNLFVLIKKIHSVGRFHYFNGEHQEF